jgi:hypothetical protein
MNRSFDGDKKEHRILCGNLLADEGIRLKENELEGK